MSSTGLDSSQQQELDQAVTLHRSGHPRQAEAVYLKILDIQPDNPVALHLLGIVHHQRGDNERACELIRKAVTAKPDFMQAHFNLGVVNQALNDHSSAQANYTRVLELAPDNADAHVNLGMVFKAQGNLDDAIKNYNRAITLNPNSVETYSNMGVVFLELEQLSEAETCFRQALKINPLYTDAMINLATTLRSQNQFDEALELSHSVIEINPELAAGYNLIGTIQKNLGDFDNASKNLLRAISFQPDYADAYRNLITIKKPKINDPLIIAMETVYNDASATSTDKMNCAFGLAEVYDSNREYRQAFTYMQEANRLKRASFTFNIEGEKDLNKRMKDTYQAKLFEQSANMGSSDSTPIFILGMPRSGTTLSEQILASHPNVCGAGELRYMREIIREAFVKQNKRFPEDIHTMNGSEVANLAELYLARLRNHGTDDQHITDKMPGNYWYIGLIKLMLPNARIIHMCRNPMDTCLSIFSKSFSGYHPYAYNLEELGQYHSLYEDLMAHWHTVLPGKILDVTYETLTQNPEQEIRRILEFCELPFHEDCLNFYQTKRGVTTASAAQVRKPMYQSARERWKNYESELEPLRLAIEKGA